MSFDSAQPADTTKIRNLGLVLRNNFQAMASGFSDTSYAPTALNLTEQAGNPGATANLGKVYCKTGPTSGKGELFYQDEDANVVQLTSAGKMGSPTTNIIANTISLNNGTTQQSSSFAICGMGIVASNVLADKFGVVSSIYLNVIGSTKYLHVTLAPVLNNSKYAVFVTSVYSNLEYYTIRNKAANGFDIGKNTSGTGFTLDFIVVGGF